MNIIQSNNEVRRLLDRVRSPRYDNILQIEPALNTAVRSFVKDRYDNIKKRTGYSFQSVERLREELYSIVTDYIPVIPVNNFIVRPSNFMYLADIRCKFEVDGDWISAEPTSYNEEQEAVSDVFSRPSKRKFYVNESKLGLRIVTIAVPLEVEYCYIELPKKVFSTTTLINPGPNLTVGSEYYAITDSVNNGITTLAGESFIAATNVLTSGTVYLIQSITLPDHIQDEIHLIAYYAIAGINQSRDKIAISKDKIAES